MRTAEDLVADVISVPGVTVLLAELLGLMLDAPEAVVQALDNRSLEDGYRFVDSCASTPAGTAVLVLLVAFGGEMESRNFERHVAETVVARATLFSEELRRLTVSSTDARDFARVECIRLSEGLVRLASLRVEEAAERERLGSIEADQAEIASLESKLELLSIDAVALTERLVRLQNVAVERDTELEALRAECKALEASLEVRKSEIAIEGARRTALASANDSYAIELRELELRVSPEAQLTRQREYDAIKIKLKGLEDFGRRLTNPPSGLPLLDRDLRDLQAEVEELRKLLVEGGLKRRVDAVYARWKEIIRDASGLTAAADRKRSRQT